MMQLLSHSSAKQQRRHCKLHISSSRTYALPRSGTHGDVECIFFSGSRLRQNIPVGEYIITGMDVTAGSRSYAEKGRSCDNIRRHPHCREYGDRRRDHVHNSGDTQKMASGSFLYKMCIRDRAVGICGGDITAYDLAEALKIEREFDRDLYDLAMTLA